MAGGASPGAPLAPGELRVVVADLSGEPPADDDHRLLDPVERARAARLVRPADGHRFVRSHAATRRILGGVLDLPPDLLVFGVLEQGKPFLPAHPDLHFNLSHSGSIMALAVTRAGPVGVDVERIDASRSMEELVARNFAPGEQAAFLALPEGERTDAFFEIWTRKEAFLKVTGEGLFRGLDSFEVTVASAAALRVVDGRPPGARWWMRDVPVPGGYRGAVVVEGRPSHLHVLAAEGG